MLEEKEEEEFAEVLYNDSYGGYDTSEKANDLHDVLNPTGVLDIRTDPTWLRIYHELGTEFNGKYSNIKVKKIPKKYILNNCYSISEYDGKEKVNIEYEHYALEQIKLILKSSDMNDEKIHRIELVMSDIYDMKKIFKK